MQVEDSLKASISRLSSKFHRSFSDSLTRYTIQDARTDYYSSIFQLTTWLRIQFEQYPRVPEQAKIFEISESDLNQFTEQYKTITMSAFLTKFQFDTEIAVCAVSKSLGIEEYGLVKNCKKLKKKLKKKLNNNWNWFSINDSATIRNSLHNNGYYNGVKEIYKFAPEVKLSDLNQGDQSTVVAVPAGIAVHAVSVRVTANGALAISKRTVLLASKGGNLMFSRRADSNRKPWKITNPDKTVSHPKFKNIHRDPKTKTW